ncbi:MAG: branched-chain amino acid ABC transporter permease [Dehalococcoidia bacterium]|nr:branched-chain amino acid ABC transporter permease [Dehalococcoidia bacterium]
MATIEAGRERFRAALRDYQRAAGGFLTGAGLWLLIGLFFVWAFFQHRDALVTGLVTGSVFALGAIGITLIYGILKFGHFAHGDSMMLSAYLAFFLVSGVIVGERQDTQALPVNLGDLPGAGERIWEFSFGYGLLLAMAAAAVIMAGVFIALDRAVYRPLRRRRSGIVIFSIASLGLALVIRSLMLIFWGADPRSYTRGFRSSFDLLGTRVLYDQLFIFCMAMLLMAAVYLLLYRTKLGKAMRAMADNPDLARISGINTEQIVLWTWGVAGALVAVAGVMLALQAQLKPEIGFIVLLPLFAAAIVGGIGSPHGALLGGLIVGAVQEVAVSTDFPLLGEVSPGYKFSIAFIVLIVILLVRPRGLFGAKQ